MKDHTFLTKKDLAARWGKDVKTINKWLAEKQIKTFRGTDHFQLDYIEGLERENLDFEGCSAFALRAKDRRIEQLEKELAMVKSTLFQMAAISNEATAKLMKGQAS